MSNEQETLRDVRMALRGYHQGLDDGRDLPNTWLLVRLVDLEIVARRTRRGEELAAYLIALDDIRATIRTGPKT